MKAIRYSYLVVPMGDVENQAYKAIIPKFKKLVIMANTPEELHSVVADAVELEVSEREKKGEKVPMPDIDAEFDGKVFIHISPELHEKVTQEAEANQMHISDYISQKLR